MRASLNPYVDLSQIEAAVDKDAEDTQASLKQLVNDLENPGDDTSTDEKCEDLRDDTYGEAYNAMVEMIRLLT